MRGQSIAMALPPGYDPSPFTNDAITAATSSRTCRHPLRAGGRIAVRCAAYLAVLATHPHQGAALRPDCIEAGTADHDAALQHPIVVIAPLAGWARDGCTLEDQRSHGSKRILGQPSDENVDHD